MEITKSLVLCCLLFININYAFTADAAFAMAHDVSTNVGKIDANENQSSIDTNESITQGDIDYYQSDNITNEIPYFDNRFSIDAKLDEITMIFFRERGSTPIVLVQPDGKKIRVNDYDKEIVQWHDDSTFDMIKIIKPMPGPWQAIGDILPKSKILVVSEVTIKVDPLPEVVLYGETLKVTGQLFNGEEKINVTAFKNVAQLDVNFFSTNNSAYDNFGRDAFKLTSFKDNGRDLDEYAGDNIYTGEFVLDFASGEWQPVYVIKLPLLTRELRQKPILLTKSPITLSVETSELEAAPHRLLLSIDPTYVDPNSLIFQGKTTFPDRQTKPFSIIKNDENTSSESRELDISYTEPGIHRVNVNAFGKTKTGREFRLVVPEFTFNVSSDLNKNNTESLFENGDNETVAKETAEQILAARKEEMERETAERLKLEEQQRTETILIIAAVNGVIIILACVVFLVMRKRKIKRLK